MRAIAEQRADQVLIRCQGHPSIKATHTKTFEITTDDSITPAGTCIIGVAASYDEDALLSLRGAVRIQMRCGDAGDLVLARINPVFRRGDPLIIRRNANVQPRTFCISATKGASGLDRELIRSLQSRTAELTVTIEQIGAAADNSDGVLYIVGMPIGNAEDISLRALDVLASVDVVLAEDTRTTRPMLAKFGIDAELISYHDHNERTRAPEVLDRLARGARMALISEAGMPLLCDPGFHLVRGAIARGIPVSPVPGPDALAAALSISGASTADVRFIGFLPRKPGARRARLQEFQSTAYTLVFFEAPHRIADTLEDLANVLPGRSLAVCRDLTKPTERVLRGDAASIKVQMLQGDQPRGELTVVVEGASPHPVPVHETLSDELVLLIGALLELDCPSKMIAAAVAKTIGMPRRDAFALVLKLKRRRTPDGEQDEP